MRGRAQIQLTAEPDPDLGYELTVGLSGHAQLVPVERWHPRRCLFGKAVAHEHEREEHGSEVHRKKRLNGKRVPVDDGEHIVALTEYPRACRTDRGLSAG